MYQLPYNVLNRIVHHADRNDQIKLAQLDYELNHVVSSLLYNTILVVDDNFRAQDSDAYPYTFLRASDLPRLTACLHPRNFHYIKRVIVNTHNADVSAHLTQFYHKVSALWSITDHVIGFVNYDVLSLRLTDSFNNYLELSLILFAEYDDGDYILAKKSRKILNLRSWFMFSIKDFLVAPASSDLKRLSLFVENNHYKSNADAGFTIEKPNFDNVKRNLAQISELFLHSALAFINFLDIIQNLQIPQMLLRRLSLTSTHRLRNDAMLNFQQMIRLFDLNNLEEFELKISCARHHECQDLCMVRFFSDWKTYNAVHGLDTNIRKLSIVHHKSLSETIQFKRIVEDYVFSSLFSNVREIFLNLSNTVRSAGPQLSIDLAKVIENSTFVPELETLHISSFFSEWWWGISLLFEGRVSSHDAMMNRCRCEECKQTRSTFIALAELDKAKNYSHKVTWGEVPSSNQILDSLVDFSLIQNVKFLQYLAGQLKQQELIMERNITSSGTMLDMQYMPIAANTDVEPFKRVFQHSCVDMIQDRMSSRLQHLKTINFGGIVVHNK